MRFALTFSLALCGWIALPTPAAHACSVPVFRYALERWPSDLFEIDVFHRGPLSDEQRALISLLEDRALINGGDRNWEIVDCNVDDQLDDDLQTVWTGLANPPLPYVVLRCPGGRQGSPSVWSGPLAEMTPQIAASKAEQALVQRLLAGDSVVWVLLRGSDAVQADQTAKLLAEQCLKLTEEIELPAGVGLPGSELLARIPLSVKLSLLDISAADSRDSVLRKTAAARMGKAVDPAATLVMPVFGRGRAVQVVTAEELDADVIAELSRFLCGACSCQVKQANPGFDLLLPAAWEELLYGDEVPSEAVAVASTDTPTEPTYVAIPAGEAVTTAISARPVTAADDAANRAADVADARSAVLATKAAKQPTDWYLLGGGVVIVGALYVWRRQAAWHRRNNSL